MSSNNVHLVSHPIVKAKLSKLRQTETTSKEFREGIHDISYIVGIDASKDLEEATFKGQSPIAAFTGTKIKPRVGLCPILRAGLGNTDALLSLFPEAPVYHLGLFREKVTLQPVEYYSKLPPSPPVDLVYILDPLIATGGTAVAAVHMIRDWGIPIEKVRFLSVLASKDGLEHITKEFPELQIWAAGIDETLTPNGLISPGLGDTGDRLFGTIRT